MEDIISMDSFIKEIKITPLVEDMMKDNEAKLYLKKSRKEYEHFLAQTISTKGSASYEQVQHVIDMINLREKINNTLLPNFMLKKEHQNE